MGILQSYNGSQYTYLDEYMLTYLVTFQANEEKCENYGELPSKRN